MPYAERRRLDLAPAPRCAAPLGRAGRTGARLAALVIVALVAACATTPTVYGPAATSGAAGYSDFPIESDRYRVTFQGGNDLSQDMVEGLALRRAGEIARERGAEWFRVVDRSYGLESNSGGGSSVGVGAAGGSSGRSSVGLGVSIDLTPPRVRHAVSLEVILGRGPQPSGPDVYGAQAAATLGA